MGQSQPLMLRDGGAQPRTLQDLGHGAVPVPEPRRRGCPDPERLRTLEKGVSRSRSPEMEMLRSPSPRSPQGRGCPAPEPLLGLGLGVIPGVGRHSPAARGLPGSCTKRFRIPPPLPLPPPAAPPAPSPSPSRAAAAADMARPLPEGRSVNRQSAPSFFGHSLSAAGLLAGGGRLRRERRCWES